MQTIVIALLRGYKLCVSPFLPSACRFYPTCSEYMLEAVRLHGTVRGTWMGLKRLGRCHPFHEGGCDPVPAPGHVVSDPAKNPGLPEAPSTGMLQESTSQADAAGCPSDFSLIVP